MRPLFARLSARQVHIYRLVLAASGISHRVIQSGPDWTIEVAAVDRRAAVRAVASYLQENERDVDGLPDPSQSQSRTYSAFFAAAVLVAVHFAIQPGFERQQFFHAFGADAGRILDGQFYRCVTALLLHADWGHLLANLAGILLFGTGVAAACGWGLGWVLILAGGALGNFCTAVWYRQAHLSVGASTAVFAAVGICAALTYARRLRLKQRSWRAWMPLAGGMALLAFLGAAPGSDLLAHLFGFIAGLAAGRLYTRHVVRAPGRRIQFLSAVCATGLIVGGYLWGFYVSG